MSRAICFGTGLPYAYCGCPSCAGLRTAQRMPYAATPYSSMSTGKKPKRPKDEVVADIEIGRYALRTFNLRFGTLDSVVKKHSWDSGVAIAQCLANDPCDSSPGTDCQCGIYGTVTLDSLIRQYRQHAHRSVAVFAAEGETLIGDAGLRTAAARIVAYWCRDDEDAQIFAAACEGAKRFIKTDEMLEAYQFPASPYSWPPPVTPTDTAFRPADRDRIDRSLRDMGQPLMGAATPGGLAAIRYALGFLK